MTSTVCRSARISAVYTVALTVVATSLSASHAVTYPDHNDARIIGGTNATEPYPFVVFAQNCGAALISPTWIISARHCYSDGNPKQVRIGSVSMDSGGEVRTIKRWVVHPQATDYSNDVMVGELDSASTMTPIEMAQNPPEAGTPTRLLGWGSTSPQPPVVRPSGLQELNTSILPAASCTKKPGETGPPSIKANNELCTDNPGKNGPCVMDSGSPQIMKLSERWVLVGVTNRSTGGNCGEKPSIYASVAAHKAWIDSVTKP